MPDVSSSLNRNSFGSILNKFTELEMPEPAVVGSAAATANNFSEVSSRGDQVDDPEDPCDSTTCDDEKKPIKHVSYLPIEFYEKGENDVILRIMVRHINKDNLTIKFSNKIIDIYFKCDDKKFLSTCGCTSDSEIYYQAHLAEEIIPDSCSVKLTIFPELTLRKKHYIKWNSVLKLAAFVGGNPATTSNLAKSELQSPSMVSGGDLTMSTDTTRSDNATTSSVVHSPGATFDLNAAKHSTVENVHKPTAKVEPFSDLGLAVTPGYTGLRNIGNTCFINSVLQVLVNTTELKTFFLSNYYKLDINVQNVLGMKGKLAHTFAQLMREMWSGCIRVYEPSNLKNLIATKAVQFANFAQHDSQEFLSFLLDGLHEDLNRVKDKPITEQIEANGRADTVVAAEAWHNHLMRNNSIIVDLYHGQLKSKLTCPNCQTVSITFDPFVYLTVPFPRSQRKINVYFFRAVPHEKPIKLICSVREDATVADLTTQLSEQIRIESKFLKVFEVFQNRIYKVYEPTDPISSIQSNDVIFVFEMLDAETVGEDIVNIFVQQRLLVPSTSIVEYCDNCREMTTQGRMCTACYKVVYCDEKCQKADWESHRIICRRGTAMMQGEPFMLSIPASKLTFSRLQQMCEARANFTVDVFQFPMVNYDRRSSVVSPAAQNDNLVSKSNCSSDENGDVIPSDPTGDIAEPMDTSESPIEEQKGGLDASAFQFPTNSNSTPSATTSTGTYSLVTPPETPISKAVRLVFGEQNSDEFKRSERLFYLCESDRDASTTNGPCQFLKDSDNLLKLADNSYVAMDWRNKSRCKDFLRIQNKQTNCQISLDFSDQTGSKENAKGNGDLNLTSLLDHFSEEEILSPQEAWYCKTCKEHREASKQLHLWRLPPLLIVQLKRFQYTNYIMRSKIEKTVSYPTRGLNLKPYVCPGADAQCSEYDLAGVVCHSGTSYFGHYISYGRSCSLETGETELEWRQFDDSRVTRSSEQQAVNKDAYLLFYRRKDSPYVATLAEYEDLAAKWFYYYLGYPKYKIYLPYDYTNSMNTINLEEEETKSEHEQSSMENEASCSYDVPSFATASSLMKNDSYNNQQLQPHCPSNSPCPSPPLPSNSMISDVGSSDVAYGPVTREASNADVVASGEAGSARRSDSQRQLVPDNDEHEQPDSTTVVGDSNQVPGNANNTAAIPNNYNAMN